MIISFDVKTVKTDIAANKVIKIEMATISKERKMCPIRLKLLREAIN